MLEETLPTSAVPGSAVPVLTPALTPEVMAALLADPGVVAALLRAQQEQSSPMPSVQPAPVPATPPLAAPLLAAPPLAALPLAPQQPVGMQRVPPADAVTADAVTAIVYPDDTVYAPENDPARPVAAPSGYGVPGYGTSGLQDIGLPSPATASATAPAPATAPGTTPVAMAAVPGVVPVARARPQGHYPGQRSPLTTSPYYCAGRMEVLDDLVWYRSATDKLQEQVQAEFKAVAKRLGITPEQLAEDDYSTANMDEVPKVPQYVKEVCDLVLVACIVDWTLLEPPTLDNIRAMGPEWAADACEQIMRSTSTGVSQEKFFRASRRRVAQW